MKSVRYHVDVEFGKSVANRTYGIFATYEEAEECFKEIHNMWAEGRGFNALTWMGIVKVTYEMQIEAHCETLEYEPS